MKSNELRCEIEEIVNNHLFFHGTQIMLERLGDFILHQWGDEKLRKAIDEYCVGESKENEMNKIEITLAKEKLGCRFDDKIKITFSPSGVHDVMLIFRDKALKTDDYFLQGAYRKIADLFQSAYGEWNDKRKDDGS